MTGNSIALDTNQAIAWLNGRTGLDDWMSRFSVVWLPVIVVGELRFGALKSQRASANAQRIELLISRCGIIEIKASTSQLYAQTRLALLQRGRPVPENDLWIASLCLEHNLTLATSDRHFEQIGGLKVVSP